MRERVNLKKAPKNGLKKSTKTNKKKDPTKTF